MKPIKILLQTTIPTASDDWPITRFTLLAQFLREQRQGLTDTHGYVRNLALWLAGQAP